MNARQEIIVLEQLAAAYAVIRKLGAEHKWADAMSVSEFTTLQIAILDAKKLIGDDIAAKIQN